MARVPVTLKESGEIVGHVSARLVQRLKLAPVMGETKRHLRQLVRLTESWVAYRAHQRHLAANPGVRAFRRAYRKDA